MTKSCFDVMSNKLEIEQTPGAIKEYLTSLKERWLLVLDGADDPDHDITVYFDLPLGTNGSIIITSRNSEYCICSSPRQAICEVESMEPEEAIALLGKVSKRIPQLCSDEENTAYAADAKLLLNKLGFLALAIYHTGLYINKTSKSPRECLERFGIETNWGWLFDQSPPSDGLLPGCYGHTVYATWELSFKKIVNETEQGLLASDILRIFSYLHYIDIPVEIFERASLRLANITKLEPELLDLCYSRIPANLLEILSTTEDGRWNQSHFKSALRQIEAFSLIKTKSGGNLHRGMLCFHPLVQSWLQWKIMQNEIESLESTFKPIVALVLALSFDKMDEGPVSRAFGDQVYAHSQCFRRLSPDTFQYQHNSMSYSSKELIINSTSFGRMYHKISQWQEAAQLFETTVQILDQQHSTAIPEYRKAAILLVSTYLHQNMYREAEKLKVSLIDAQRVVLSYMHPDIIECFESLTSVYQEQGYLPSAGELALEAIELRIHNAKPVNPDNLLFLIQKPLIKEISATRQS
ncbi:Similar to hypothetical protein PIIN_09341 [Piriformospora indica DSM 11827]; acc. no. CCA75357 [Pyronema omphalodes CBS 100304]|uniref:NB-ARC domain-containing protein n=1 Tax=Pyronema omphalodes (strain CBS 100304) TaxID=1076935 RepID=U4L7Q1_PYROM|nr:Similar to hypothetical protein PIIN_09341 [Piriformospora indica DSM 11827]; acc. no. CCA75357 [Pyronema omphalodes CBS 100304]